MLKHLLPVLIAAVAYAGLYWWKRAAERKSPWSELIAMGTMLFLVASCTATHIAYSAETLRVVDGDTIVLNGESIRLAGIDAPEYDARWPEKAQPYGLQATAMLEALIDGQPLMIERVTTGNPDPYGRTLAHVTTADGRNVAAWMVGQGYAWCWEPCSVRLQGLQWVAQTQQRGLWAGDAVRPSEYRKR